MLVLFQHDIPRTWNPVREERLHGKGLRYCVKRYRTSIYVKESFLLADSFRFSWPKMKHFWTSVAMSSNKTITFEASMNIARIAALHSKICSHVLHVIRLSFCQLLIRTIWNARRAEDCSFAGFQVLQKQMPQKFQDEAKSKKGEVDKGIQKAGWQRAC